MYKAPKLLQIDTIYLAKIIGGKCEKAYKHQAVVWQKHPKCFKANQHQKHQSGNPGAT